MILQHLHNLMQQSEKRNRRTTFKRIKRIFQNSIEYANSVYSNVEFHTTDRRHGVQKGIKFQMTDYLIDNDEACHYHSR